MTEQMTPLNRGKRTPSNFDQNPRSTEPFHIELTSYQSLPIFPTVALSRQTKAFFHKTMSNKVMLRLLALMLLFLATVANRGSNLNQKPAVVPKEKPFRRQGWGLHPKDKPVKEGKTVRDSLPKRNNRDCFLDWIQAAAFCIFS